MSSKNTTKKDIPSVTPTELPEVGPGTELSPEIPGENDLQFDSAVGMTLADAIREGSKETAQTYGWGDGVETACALTAAGIVVKNKGYR